MLSTACPGPQKTLFTHRIGFSARQKTLLTLSFFSDFFSLYKKVWRALPEDHLDSPVCLLPRAATQRAQLTVTTSPAKRRKVSPEAPSRPGEARRHGHSEPPPVHPSPPHRSSSALKPRSKSSSPSPPRYVPAHLQSHVPGTKFKAGVRSPTPATATAGLSLSSEHSDMPPDTRDGTLPTNGDGRSPSPGEKRPVSEIADPDPEGGVRMDTSDDNSGPSIDDQIARVFEVMMQPVKYRQKGYVISMAWLKKVFARSSTHANKADKEALQSELGPVDNSDIFLDLGPTQHALKDEKGDPFVPLRPGLQLGEDYEIVPQEGWDLIMKWYGLADQSPVIVRYAHNTNPDGPENIVYELNPSIFTVFKLANPAAGTTPQVLKERNNPPVKILAGHETRYMKWLKDVKQLARIENASKVRVWKIIGGIPSANVSTSTTPAVSRAASPAPVSALTSSINKSILLDLNTFLSLDEGTQREKINVDDQTHNKNYNGKMTMGRAGLVGSDILVLEEQVAGSKGGEWVSDASERALKRAGLSPEKPKKPLVAATTNSQAGSGRSSPASDIVRGRKNRRPLGLTGLSNLGNTCYQNAATQCVRSVEELTYYFLSNTHKSNLNVTNPLGYKGQLARAYADLIQSIYAEPPQSSISPNRFRRQIGQSNPIMSGFEQHDSQEFLMFLLDGLSEDLNRILDKPYIEKPDSTDEMVHNQQALEEFAAKSWEIYKARNDSVVVDLFAGMYKSTLNCPKCHKVSIIFDPFSNLTLPLPEPQTVFKEIIYMALDKRPTVFTVEANKSRPVLDWHKSVALRSKRDIDAQRLISADCSGSTFFGVHVEDHVSYDQLNIRQQDKITFMELDSPKSESVLIPVFHRQITGTTFNGRTKRTTFALPYVISLTAEEVCNLEAIWRKILRHATTMTTRDIMNESQQEAESAQQSSEDPDTVVMTDEDAKSVDSRIKTSSVEGEDSMVDISMQDASQTPSASAEDTEIPDVPPAHPLANVIAPSLLKLFDLKVVRGRGDDRHSMQDGHSLDAVREYTPLVSEKNDEKAQAPAGDNSDDYTDTDGSSNTSYNAPEGALIREGDAILVDWNDDAVDALFGGSGKQGDLRGSPTFNPENLKVPHDPEIIQRRAQVDHERSLGITLDQCLDEFSKTEILGENDAWYCPSCKDFRQASKKFELWAAPDILVIHLKRFGSMRRKLGTRVDFPINDLDLSGRVNGPDDGKSLKYDLIAVDCHSGGMGGGHYYAFAKNFITGEWCNFNDNFARVIDDPTDVISPQAYLLFYRRQSTEPLGGPALREIVTKYKNHRDEAIDNDAGEDQLPGDSHNGSSSVSAAAAAPHPMGDEDEGERETENPLDRMFQEPSWSFDRAADGPIVPRPASTGNDDGDADLFGDNDSTAAVGDGDSELDTRLADLDHSGPVSEHEGSFEDVPPLQEDGSDDELPVVELRVGDDDKMAVDA